MTSIRQTAPLSLTIIAAIGLSACSKSAPPTPDAAVQSAVKRTGASETFSTIVNSKGDISRPTDYATNPDWVHIGSWSVVNAEAKVDGMHNVYTTRDVVAEYAATGAFPDGAVLVKEVAGVDHAQLSTGNAHWSGEPAVWFVSVKDASGRFADNPLWGEGWGWALFKADAPMTQVATDYRADCLGCHLPAAESDHMYVYAYPPLGPKARAFAPASAPQAGDAAGESTGEMGDTQRMR
ncbi:MAG: cytochrome P460 family protein [Parvularculaceae bacterium]|nr:cytochrome P460 family protein [Parvularculaceae bacterium]